jgi:transglutaminase-like putative cysteine protease
MNLPRSIPATGLLSPRSPRTRAAGPLLPAPTARLIGFAGLASFGALQWGRLLAPGAGGAMLGALVAALAAGGALTTVARARPSARRRWAAGLVAAIVLLLVAFAGAGVPASLLLDPRGWGELARGIGDGLNAIPSVTVPYGGAEEWTRAVLILGGAALIGLAALLAFAPRRDGRFGYPVAAAVALGTLYASPVIQRHADHPFVSGLAFAMLLALFLWLERVERRNTATAVAIVTIAAVAGLIAAPRLDGNALLDYEQLAQSLSQAQTTQYSWNHSYGPLDWPRDGREVLRVSSPRRAYWKAVNLTAFDGLHWVQDADQPGTSADITGVPDRDWIQTIRVTIRALRSTDFITAGTVLGIADRGTRGLAPGVPDTTADRVLKRGESYRAAVYVPRPTTRQMRAAGNDYPRVVHSDYGFMRVPSRRPGQPDGEQTVGLSFWGDSVAPGAQALTTGAFQRSPYAGVYDLARRLRAQSSTPYDFMRAVERYLARGFSYSETPPASRVPLADFLLRDKVGYCQQFSGAMALLLRLGGVPARVSAGFAPGSLDDKSKEYVVRDIDAHSWVEVYFPGLGWVTRDPTPSASPARSQTADLATAGTLSDVTLGGRSERVLGGSTDRGRASTPATSTNAEGSSLGLVVLGGALAVLVLAALAVVLRRRRRRPPAIEDELAELRRALRRSGRDPQPHLTLELLAARLGGTAAEGYVRTLAAARYGYESARPSRDQRAGLRRELAAGLGLRGRARAWWALPPRAPSIARRA